MSISDYWVVFVSGIPCNSEKDWSIHFVVVHTLLCWSIDTSSLVNFVLSFLFHHETTAKAKFSFYAKENGSWVFWAFFCQLFLFSELSVILQVTFWLYDYNDLGQFIQLYYLQCQPPCWCYFIFFYKGIKTVKSNKTIIYYCTSDVLDDVSCLRFQYHSLIQTNFLLWPNLKCHVGHFD